MNLRELQQEAHAIALSKGWWDEERTFGDLIALVHSELSEALEAYRLNPNSVGPIYWHNVGTKRPPFGVAIELADVVIRGGGHSGVVRGGLGRGVYRFHR